MFLLSDIFAHGYEMQQWNNVQIIQIRLSTTAQYFAYQCRNIRQQFL